MAKQATPSAPGRRRPDAAALAAILLTAALLLLGILQASCRYSLQDDELFSYCLSNNEKSFKLLGDPWSQGEYHDGWLWGSGMRAYLQVDEGTGFDYPMVYKHQREDVHPPLYYLLLHTVSSLFPGSFSPWLGLSLNLAAYGGCLWLLWALAAQLFGPGQGGRWAALAVPLVWALLPCTTHTTLLMRMYSLLSFWVLLFAVLLCGMLLRRTLSLRTALGLGLVVLLGSQTHYYFYVYGGLLAFFAGLWMLLERWPLRALLLYAGSGAAGLALSWAAYPYLFQHAANMVQNNGGQSRTLLAGLLRAADLILRQDLGEKRVLLLALLAGLLAAVVLIQRRGRLPRLSRRDGLLVLLGACGLCAAPVIMKLSGIYNSRYLAPIYPLLVPGAVALAGRLAGAVQLPKKLTLSRPRRQAAAFALAGALALVLWGPVQHSIWRENRAEQRQAAVCLEALGDRSAADCVWAAPEVDYLLGDEFCALAGFDEVCPVSLDELGIVGLPALLARRASPEQPVWLCTPLGMEEPLRAALTDAEAQQLAFAAADAKAAYYRYTPPA